MKKFILLILLSSVFSSCEKKVEKRGFERIIFHTSGCFGFCPAYHLEIDSSKNIKLFAEFVYKDDSINNATEDKYKMGYFTGKVEDSVFFKLKNIIDTIGISNLQFEEDNCCDGSMKTMISYYDGKRNYLKSMHPPSKAYYLISALTEICKHNKLKKTNTKFEIEE